MSELAAYKKSSFGPAFLFLSRRKRQALAHYYEFCRLADDIVDEPSDDPQKALQALRQEIQFVFIRAPRTKLGKQLLKDVQHFHLSEDRFRLLLEGMEADLQHKSYAPDNQEDLFGPLDWYIYRVAVIVGKTTLDILGVKGPKADELAQTLGTAVQLTNIIRDVYEDAKLGRVYLPCQLSAEEILLIHRKNHTLQDTSLILGSVRANVLKTMFQRCASRAQENYQRAFQLLDEFWPISILPCRIMGYIYQRNLVKIEKTNFTFKKPIKLNKLEKTKAVLYAILKTFF